MTIDRAALAKAVVAIVLFASVPAAIRESKLDAWALGIARLTLAGLGMSLFMMGRRRRSLAAWAAEVRRSWLVLLAVGLLFGLHWLFYFLSIKHASASIGVLGFCTYGAQLPVLGWAFGFGRPGVGAVLGLMLALMGTWLCLPAQTWESADAAGLAIAVLSGTSYAMLPLLHQRHDYMDHDVRTWAQFCFALPVFLPMASQAEWSWTAADLLLLVHLGLIVTLVGHYLWVQATTELPIQVTSVLAYLQLPVGLGMNYLLIGDRMTASMLGGAALIVGANALALGVKSPEARELPAE